MARGPRAHGTDPIGVLRPITAPVVHPGMVAQRKTNS
jgi:hypothetical protein